MQLPPHLSPLPQPAPDAAVHSERLMQLIRREIIAHAGWISFARYMELALYAPGLGYYSAGAAKFGAAGDFVTAPEISPLFGRTLAQQIAQFTNTGLGSVLELGAGSGALAADLLTELASLGALPERYLILETSAELRERQCQRLARLAPDLEQRVTWLDALPRNYAGVIIGNEVLDAMPVHVVTYRSGAIDELGVGVEGSALRWQPRPAAGAVLEAARQLALPPGYTTEIHFAAHAFIRTLADTFARGAALLIDYGFPGGEYYHPQRSSGTLMCHYRHHAHDDPFSLIGLQDITAHVDFSAIAATARDAGLDVLGYCSQAQFLINCGIADRLAATPAAETGTYLPLAAQAQKLLSPAEMGELFKVLALGKNYSAALVGFARGDRSATL